MARMHIVATTIWLPRFLNSYVENLRHYGHLEGVKVWVVGGRRSPDDSAAYAARVRGDLLDVEDLNAKIQVSWLGRYRDLEAIVPWNTDHRRNMGFRRALNNDPIPTSDFCAGPLHAGQEIDVPVIAGESDFGSASLTGGDHFEAVRSLAAVIAAAGKKIEAAVRLDGITAYSRRVSRDLNTWVDVCTDRA